MILEKEFLLQAKLAEKLVLWRNLKVLKGVKADTALTEYKDLHGQLNLLLPANTHFEAAYILGFDNNKKLFYYNYSVREDTSTVLMPGYPFEQPEMFAQIINAPRATILGPYKRNGKLVVTAAIPLIDPYSRKFSGIFAIDQDGEEWNTDVLGDTFIPVIVPALVIILLIWVSFEISRRKIKGMLYENSEKKLKETRFQFEKTMSVLDDIVYMVDAESGEFSYLNPAFEKLLGYNARDIEEKGGRKKFLESIIQDKQFTEQDELLGQLKTGEKHKHPDWISWWKCKNGDLVLLEDRWIEVIEEGKLIGTFGILRNITERMKTEEELAGERLLMQTLMDNIPDRIFFKDKESRYIRVNRAMIKNLGFTEHSEIEGKNYLDLFAPEHAFKVRKDDLRILTEGIPLLDYDEYEVLKDGKEKWFSTSKLPWRNKEGEIIGLFGISRDISLRKLSEDNVRKQEMELRELNSMKDKLFSIISHDLKNPFFNIMQFVSTLNDEFDNISEKERREMVTQLKMITDNGFSLLENLLTWSKSQLNKIDLQIKQIEVEKITAPVIEALTISAKQKEVSLESNLPHNYSVLCDLNFTSAVLRNLIMNALKFSPRKGKIVISVADKENEAVFSVKDNGIGMPQSIKEKIFRVDNSLKRKGTEGEPGTGLGLLLCKDFVERMKGRIWFESREGEGTTFYFSLPKTSQRG